MALTAAQKAIVDDMIAKGFNGDQIRSAMPRILRADEQREIMESPVGPHPYGGGTAPPLEGLVEQPPSRTEPPQIRGMEGLPEVETPSFAHELGQSWPIKQIVDVARSTGETLGTAAGEAVMHGPIGAAKALVKGIAGDPIGGAAAIDPESRMSQEMLASSGGPLSPTPEERATYPASLGAGHIARGVGEAAIGSAGIRAGARLLRGLPLSPITGKPIGTGMTLGARATRAGMALAGTTGEGAAIGGGMAALSGQDVGEGIETGSALGFGAGALGRVSERIASPLTRRGQNIQAVRTAGGEVGITGSRGGKLSSPEVQSAGFEARGKIGDRAGQNTLDALDQARADLSEWYAPFKQRTGPWQSPEQAADEREQSRPPRTA